MARSLLITRPSPGEVFAINEEGVMPMIEVELDAECSSLEWTAELSLDCSLCKHGPKRVVSHRPLSGASTKARFTVRFTQVRGGILAIRVKAEIEGEPLAAEVAVKIVGTNPAKEVVARRFPDKALRQVASFESGGLRQFREDGWPLFSADNLGGVGMMQITNPPPEDDEIWDWKANLTKGRLILSQKSAASKRYPATVRASPGFLAETAGKTGVPVTLPDFTPDQLLRDSLRGYNGYAGKDAFGLPLHEFRVKRDERGKLWIEEQTGLCAWEEVPAADRPQKSGDPDYVRHVLAQSV